MEMTENNYDILLLWEQILRIEVRGKMVTFHFPDDEWLEMSPPNDDELQDFLEAAKKHLKPEEVKIL
jgi:hypothetical protein